MGLTNSKVFKGWLSMAQWEDDFVLSDNDSVTPLFKVAQANGNTTIAGSLTVAGTLTASGGVTATSANALNSSSTTVNVSSATAPTSGQVLTATGGSAATWQTPVGGISNQGVVTGSRSFTTYYHNTHATPLFVSVTTNDSAGVSIGIEALTDATTTPGTVVARLFVPVTSINHFQCLSFWVLPGNYYQVQQTAGTANATTWTEWY